MNIDQLDHGWRARVGLIVPSANAAAEPEIRLMLPPGVSLHITRVKLTGSSRADIEGMAAGATEAAMLLADARVDLVAFHCTAASVWSVDADEALRRDIEARSGLPATTTATALLAALEKLDARRISLISPYTEEINARERRFLEAHDIEVLNARGLGLENPHDMYAVEPKTWIDLAMRHNHAEAAACFVSCAAIRTAGVIDELEASLGIPVLTSNQVMAWDLARRVLPEMRIEGFGALFGQG
ncbi:hypothetical protein KDX09_35485 [Burkholderia cenocepacia]|uniref:maleate cis-trans isomerase family protein n=1 Tax=Burkholderia cenocepacia TaxID=95486 RepID=UPI001B9D9F97|nr:hypothetical protein [Burkholderia cenocepacia]